ncbi:MAG: hypothetical protein H6922_02305 [Pseudomonadaceae bacterium]|nr:hypothetical protein [Pseudomonadaceae bacterium]
MRVFWAFVVMMAVCLPLWAQQVKFSAKLVGGDVRLSYAWHDVDRQEQTLAFNLPIDDVQRGRSEFRSFDNAAMRDYVFAKVKGYAEAHSGPGLQLEVARTTEGYDVQAKGARSDEIDAQMLELAKVRDAAVEEFMANTLYTRVDARGVMPDHKRIAKRYAPALAPVQAVLARQLRGQDARAVVDYLLGFLQTIPYDQLQNRYTSNGAGFQTPYGLLLENKGDCDTKSVALAALLRGLYPTLRITMVYVPNHAFVGVALPRGPADYALKLGNGVFVLADPTGPRLMRLGEVDSVALRDLEAGKYSYQEVPF